MLRTDWKSIESECHSTFQSSAKQSKRIKSYFQYFLLNWAIKYMKSKHHASYKNNWQSVTKLTKNKGDNDIMPLYHCGSSSGWYKWPAAAARLCGCWTAHIKQVYNCAEITQTVSNISDSFSALSFTSQTMSSKTAWTTWQSIFIV